MARTQVNIVVAATSLAAIGAAWTGITRADAHAAAAKAALQEEVDAQEAEAAAGAPAEVAPVPQVITVPAVGPSGPTLSDRLGAAPALQLAPLAPIRVGAVAPASNGASALVPAPAATQPVVSAPVGAAMPPAAAAAPAAPVAAPPVAAPAPVVAAAPAPAAPAPAPAPAPAAKKATKAS